MAKKKTVYHYEILQEFTDPYSGQVYGAGQIKDALPGWADSDIRAAASTGLIKLIEVEDSDNGEN